MTRQYCHRNTISYTKETFDSQSLCRHPRETIRDIISKQFSSFSLFQGICLVLGRREDARRSARRGGVGRGGAGRDRGLDAPPIYLEFVRAKPFCKLVMSVKIIVFLLGTLFCISFKVVKTFQFVLQFRC